MSDNGPVLQTYFDAKYNLYYHLTSVMHNILKVTLHCGQVCVFLNGIVEKMFYYIYHKEKVYLWSEQIGVCLNHTLEKILYCISHKYEVFLSYEQVDAYLNTFAGKILCYICHKQTVGLKVFHRYGCGNEFAS